MEKLGSHWISYEMMTWEYETVQEQQDHFESLKISDWKVFGKPYKSVTVYQRPMITIHDMYFKSNSFKLDRGGELVDNFSHVYDTITWKYNSEDEQVKHRESIKGEGFQLLNNPEILVSLYQRIFNEMMHYKRTNREFTYEIIGVNKKAVSIW